MDMYCVCPCVVSDVLWCSRVEKAIAFFVFLHNIILRLTSLTFYIYFIFKLSIIASFSHLLSFLQYLPGPALNSWSLCH